MKQSIFYSWQSDLPNSTNRGFIQDALERACNSVRAIGDAAVEPVVDRDTANVPGAPDIAQTILQKIDAAAIFVADISIINHDGVGRPTPNPNVLIELGYAIRAMGWSRIVLIMNTAFGGAELMPFDLRGKRALTYSVAKESGEKATERKKLQALLEQQLRPGLATHLEDADRTAEAQVLAAQRGLQEAMVGHPTTVTIHAGAVATIPTAIREIIDGLSKLPLDSWRQSNNQRVKAFLGLADQFTGACSSFLAASQSLEQHLGRAVRHYNYSRNFIALNDAADKTYILGRVLGFRDDQILPILDIPKHMGSSRFGPVYEKAMSDEGVSKAVSPFLESRRVLLAAQEALVQGVAPRKDDGDAVSHSTGA